VASQVFSRPIRGRVTWRSSSTRMAPVVKRQPIGWPRLRKRGKPTRAPARLPCRLSDHARSARARASSPELYASLEFSRHQGARTSFSRFHARRSAASDHPKGSLRGRPITSSSWERAMLASTFSRPQLKARRAAPQWEASAERCRAVGSRANRYPW
jgi:hypothetical protein